MNYYFCNQEKHFEKHLVALIKRPVMTMDKRTLKEKVSTLLVADKKTLDQLNLDFLFGYNIFPNHIMTFLTQWKFENRPMKVGDTILQQVFLPPVRSFSQKILFGVRINSIINEPTRKGFSYQTLEGHVEKGESSFTIENLDNGIVFRIHTFSEPTNWLSKMAGPFFALPYQRFCTRSALENVKRQLV